MTTIIRTNQVITDSRAPFLTPSVPGVEVGHRWAASTVPGAVGDLVATIPDAAGNGMDLNVRVPANNNNTLQSYAGVRFIKIPGSYETEFLVSDTAFMPMAGFTVLLALNNYTANSRIATFGNTGLGFGSSSEAYMGRGSDPLVTGPTSNGLTPHFAAFVVDGANSSITVDGVTTPVTLSESTSKQERSWIGRANASASGTGLIDAAFIPKAMSAEQIQAARAVWKSYYPTLP